MIIGYAAKVEGRKKTLQDGKRSFISIAADALSSNKTGEILAWFP
jgi:hypothetical protein